MPNFALKKIEAVKGSQVFEKLIIDGICPFDEFEEGLEEIYKSELVGLYTTMNEVANNRTVPYTRFHPFDKGKKGTREWEFKTKNLRVYCITQKGGKIVVTGGTKANQQNDITSFRNIKDKYLKSLNKQVK